MVVAGQAEAISTAFNYRGIYDGADGTQRRRIELLREKADRYMPTRLMHKLLPENAYVPAHFLRKLILDYWLQQLSKTA
jgi:hypothetical protein